MSLALLAVPADGARHDEGPPPARGPEASGVASSPYRDRDRDRIYDDLETAMAARGDAERLAAIVVLTHPLSDEDLRRLRADHGEFPLKARWSVLDGFAAELTKGQITAMARRPDVVQIEPEVPVQATMGTARSRYGVDKAVADFGVNGDRNGTLKSFSPTDVVSCVLDTGIHTAHADLDQGQVVAWKDYVAGKTSPYDDNGHGTHVAGILAGQGDASSTYRGVAFGSALVGVKVLDSTGGGSSTGIINGIDFCVANKAAYNVRVLNMSLGTSGSSDGTDAMSVATNNAFDHGILPVVAAGNSGPAAYTIGSPGAAAKALTVCSLADPGERGFFAS
ncbi:MAG TPA: S8 family serine peptidase, partial [Acidimicrobiales bacterium]|nr:S8 family serine peptidase [Acidimicrobiales bacterium]